MDKRVEIALILSATDKMSAIISKSVDASIGHLNRLNAASSKMKDFGKRSMAFGAAVAAPVAGITQIYAEQEKSALQMRIAMTEDGNKFNKKDYNDLKSWSNKQTAIYGATAGAYMDMVTEARHNGLTKEDILGGIGEANNQLAVVFDVIPQHVAEFTAGLRRDMGVLPGQMAQMVDYANRLHKVGIGKTGEETVQELKDFYSQAGLGAHLLGQHGVEATKQLGTLGAIYMQRKLSGATVGQNVRKIEGSIRDPDKMNKVNAIAAGYGISLDFFDKKGSFKGYASMVGELDKLKGLNPSQISAILKPFGAKNGLSADFIAALSKGGVEDWNKINHIAAKQSALKNDAKVIMSGIGKQEEMTKNLAINAAADIGEKYKTEVISFLHTINSLIAGISGFANKYPTLTKVIAVSMGAIGGLAITLGAGSYTLGKLGKTADIVKSVFGSSVFRWIPGMFKDLGMSLLSKVVPAMVSFTTTVWANATAWLANPATWIVLGIIAAVAALVAIGYVVYKNWDKILSWFSDKWIVLKASVAGMISVFKLFGDVLIGVGKAYIGAFTFNPKLMVEGAKQAASAVNSIANGGISKAFASGVTQSLKDSHARINSNGDVIHDTVKGVAKNNVQRPASVTNHYNVNFHGVKTDDPKAMADQFSKFLKNHNDKQKRVAAF